MTWLLTALAGGLVLMFLLARNTTGIVAYFEAVGRLLLAPLTLLRLAGDPQLRDVDSWQDGAAIVLCTLAAVPFLLAVVALVRYLRADWPTAPTIGP